MDRIGFKINEDLKHRFKMAVTEDRRDMSEVLIDFCEFYVTQHEKLNRLQKTEHRPLADLLREAVDEFMECHKDDFSEQPSIEELREKIRALKPMLREQYDVEALEIFGSYARGEKHPDSDLDVLVTFGETPSLLTIVGLEDALTDALHVPVDVISKTSVRPELKERIFKEAMTV